MRPHRLVYPRRYRRRLEDIYEWIAAENPAAAPGVIEQIRIAVERLKEFPEIGRLGRVPGTRELVIADTPYIVPYRIKNGTVQIITVMHSAQRWPDRFP